MRDYISGSRLYIRAKQLCRPWTLTNLNCNKVRTSTAIRCTCTEEDKNRTGIQYDVHDTNRIESMAGRGGRETN